jgi:hypothetical protein
MRPAAPTLCQADVRESMLAHHRDHRYGLRFMYFYVVVCSTGSLAAGKLKYMFFFILEAEKRNQQNYGSRRYI